MLSSQVACPGGGGGTVCRPASAEEMPRSPVWEIMPAQTPMPETSAPAFAPAPLDHILTITSVPDGVDIYVGDERVGTTPLQLRQPPGEITLRAELDGYAAAPHTFVVDQDLDARVTMVTEEEANRPTEICEHRGRGFVLA